MKTTTRKAFTLLEVVLAISLVLGILVATFRFYRYVADTRDAVGESMRFQRSVRGVMDRLTAEFNGAIERPLMEERVEWLSDTVTFNTTVLPGPAAWADPGFTEAPVPPVHDVHLVTYAIRTGEDDRGDPVNEGLERTSLTAAPLPLADEAPVFRSSVLLAESIKFIRFRYWAGRGAGGVTDDGWVTEWGRTSAPPAVEITLGREACPEDLDVEDYLDRYETFRRIVYLPAGRSDTR
ncbi:MAG: PulJ/GspJ family protein [Planctomycetota bacterium]